MMLMSIDSSSRKSGWAIFNDGQYQISGVINLDTTEYKKKNKNYADRRNFISCYSKNSLPYDKMKILHNIDKVIFIDCSFNEDSTFYLKEFLYMLVNYKGLRRIGIHHNNINPEFSPVPRCGHSMSYFNGKIYCNVKFRLS